MPNLDRYSFRPGTAQDISAMALITERTNADRAGMPLPIEIPDDSVDHRELIERSDYPGFWSHIALQSGNVVGFVAGYPGRLKINDENNSEYLWMLMVDPDHKRRGLGRALIELAANTAIELGSAAIFLQTNADNQPAQSLYTASGYVFTENTLSRTGTELARYRLQL